MTAVVIAKNNGDILVGLGNKWLTDTLKHDKAELVADQRAFAERPNEELLTKWAERVHQPVKYSLFMKDGVRKCRFLIQGDPGSFGFPKGNIEAHETPQNAAVREFEEETGFRIPDGKLVPLGDNVFKFDATDEERRRIIESWEAMGRKGELFTLEWMSTAHVRARPAMNPASKRALEMLRDGGVRRTRRRRLTRKTRRTYKCS